MSDIQQKLEQCFQAVFPDFSPEAARSVTAAATPGWDSTALVTLMSVVEEEFGIAIQVEDLEHWTSFEAIREYLAKRAS